MNRSEPLAALRVAASLCGYTELARRLGLSLTTVHGWHLRNSVPAWRAPQLATISETLWKEHRARHAGHQPDQPDQPDQASPTQDEDRPMTDTDQPDNLVLRMLRSMDIKIDRVIAEQRAAKAHLLAMAETLLAVRKDIQNLDERLTRVETRLDLRDVART